jgi:hypothetical protein
MHSGKSIYLTEMDSDLIEVDTAHFGLTLIRASALKRMPQPWFGQIKAEDDSLGDDDIFFWRRFKECGNRLFVASRVAIGHCQNIVTWPTENMGVHMQYVSDYHKNGIPRQARQ